MKELHKKSHKWLHAASNKLYRMTISLVYPDSAVQSSQSSALISWPLPMNGTALWWRPSGCVEWAAVCLLLGCRASMGSQTYLNEEGNLF